MRLFHQNMNDFLSYDFILSSVYMTFYYPKLNFSSAKNDNNHFGLYHVKSYKKLTRHRKKILHYANTILLITAFLGLWYIFWAFEDLIALSICKYFCFFISNCYVIVIGKNDSHIYEFLRKNVFEKNVKLSLLHPDHRIPVNKQ